MSQAAATAATPIADLVRLVTSDGVNPLDAAHVATILEYNGWTDQRAARYGYEDVFALAEVVYDQAGIRPPRVRALPEGKQAWYVRLLHVLRLYLRGLSFAAPMLVSSASVLALRYSLWSYVDFSTEIATAIALATFASFLVAGGFTQSIARRGLFYISQDQYGLARSSSLRLVLAGFGMLGLVAVGMVLFVLLIPILPWRMISTTLLYFVPLTSIWLGVCLLYMLNREPTILGLIAFGIGLVYFLYEVMGMPMMTAQVIGMFAVAAASFILAIFLMHFLERFNVSEFGQRVFTRQSQVGYSLAPFFIYGIAYFALTFVDRVMAWSRPQEFHPYFLWFLGDYELGIDWALWTLILPMGIVEVYIDGLFRRLKQRADRYTVDDIGAFRRPFRREHLRTSFTVLLAGLFGILLILWVMSLLVRHGLINSWPLADPRTRFVFFMAAPAFSIITVGLHNVLVLFSLNEPWAAARACGIAVLCDTAVGFLASRYLTYSWAVVGLVVGAVLFALLTSREALRVLERLDYFMVRGT